MTSHEALINFFLNAQISTGVENFFYCLNRGEFIPRLARIAKLTQNAGFDMNKTSLIVSSAGEIGNNSFDHNLGYWKDVPGICISWSLDDRSLTLGFADRGRGIISSLQPVLDTMDPQEILNMAFEKIVSGRTPEQRGNGLKYVRNAVLGSSNNYLCCISNNVYYEIGKQISPSAFSLPILPLEFGTITFIQWSRQ